MRAVPRALTASVAGAALVLLCAPVGAQDGGAAAPRAEAQASALRVNLFGNEVIISAAEVAADSGPAGTAQGTGAFVGAEGFGRSEAAADADTPSAGSSEPVCSDVSFPEEIPAPVGGVTACSTAEAMASEGQGTATASGLAADLVVGDTADLEELGLPVDQLTEALLDPLLELLGQAPLPEQLDDLDVLIETLLANPLTLANVQAGTTEATATGSESAATATATSQGVRIELLVSSVLGPLATIVIGEASSTATVQDGVATAHHALAPVTIELGIALATALGTDEVEIPVPEGQVVDIPLPAPLQSRITVSSGTDTVDGASSSATGSAVRLDLFTGLPEGGIVLAASDTAAAVEGVAVLDAPPVEQPVVQPAPPVEREALPRTGGDGRWIPVAVLLGLAGGVSVLALRRHHPVEG